VSGSKRRTSRVALLLVLACGGGVLPARGALGSGGLSASPGAGTSSRRAGVPLPLTAHDGRFWAGGAAVILRGVYMPVSGLDARFDLVESWKMNFVRLNWQWGQVEPNHPVKGVGGEWIHTYDAAYVARVRAAVTAASQRGLWVVLGNYWDRTKYFNWPDWLYQAAYNSHGVTYPLTPEGKTLAETDYWSDDLRQEFMTAQLSYMAVQFAATPGVTGYEVMNEPPWGTLPSTHETTQLILDSQLSAARAIRTADPARVLFFMTRGYFGLGTPNADLAGFVALGNVALDVHDYGGARWGSGFNNKGSADYGEAGQAVLASLNGNLDTPNAYIGSVASQLRWVQGLLDVLEPWGIPMVIGEFGDSVVDPGIYTYFGTTTTAFNALGVSWSALWLSLVVDNQTMELQPWAAIVIAAAGAPPP
jgi:cellulase (glycosyl hydrolase family 5)